MKSNNISCKAIAFNGNFVMKIHGSRLLYMCYDVLEENPLVWRFLSHQELVQATYRIPFQDIPVEYKQDVLEELKLLIPAQ